MLSAEQAHARLESYRNPNFEQDQLKRVWAIWGNTSNIGQILIQAGPAWKKVAENPQQAQAAQTQALSQLCALKPGQRRKLFKALLPKLAQEIESTWDLFDRFPYQTSYYRRPFRMPGQPSPVARGLWLKRLLQASQGYDQPVDWFATWAPYLGYWAPDSLGYLFAGAIEAGGESGQQVFDILVASADGSHDTGRMGRHVVRGLACASRPDGWDFIERLLLSAQREEGLRQVILESVDEAHPQLFRRLFHLILEQRLTRFSATIRALDVWFGLALESLTPKMLSELLGCVLRFLDDPPSRQTALLEGSAEEAYYALWAMAFDDAQVALPHAVALHRSPDLQRRFAATHLLAQMEIQGSFHELLEAMEDPDLSVVARAVAGLSSSGFDRGWLEKSDFFERIERLVSRLPHKTNTFKPPLWDWLPLKLDRDKLASMLVGCLGERPPKRLFPYLSIMDSGGRAQVAGLLSGSGFKDAGSRQALFTLAGDSSSYVRSKSLEALHGFKLTEEETHHLEGLLTRQAADLRRGVIQLLLELPDPALLKSAERLLEAKHERQRMAGLELLRECIRSQRHPPECRRLAANYQARAGHLESEASILEDILAEDVQDYSLQDALGLMDPQNRTPARPPRTHLGKFVPAGRVKLGSQAAIEILKALDALIDEHRAQPVELILWDGNHTELLGNTQYGFPAPDPTQPLEADLERLPLRQVWEDWYHNRPPALRDSDGFELYRAAALIQLFTRSYEGFSIWRCQVHENLQDFLDARCDFKLNYEPILSPLLYWLIRSHPTQDETSFLLDALEASASRIPKAELVGVNEVSYFSGTTRAIPPQRLAYLRLCRWQRSVQPGDWHEEQHTRLWAVVRWLDEPKPGLPRFYPELEDALYAWRSGAATRDDVLDLVLGGRLVDRQRYPFNALRELSGRKAHPLFKTFPEVRQLVEDCRERIISIEIRRGDLPTAATLPALALRSVPGMANLFRLVAALGKTSFDRGWHWGENRQSVLSGLARITYPLESDTLQGFAELVKTYKIPDRCLVELAVYAPQWAAFVEECLGWPKLREAVFWLYAHTKDRQWYVEKEILELWTSQVSEYTPLSPERLMDGAADSAWFHQVYQALGEQRWLEVYRCAELTASGNGHARARLFADAMLGQVSADALIERFNKKRHQDSVRALGLVPLPPGAACKAEVLRRYQAMQEFIRSGKKYGSQRQASEKLAAAIGMENLARSAGYADPLRLEWAMEVQAVADLASGPVAVEVEETRVSLSIDELGEPIIDIMKNGKPLKSIPARIKKDPGVASLLRRKKELERQASRMRQSLEQAMCRADAFSPAELSELFHHPLLRTMLEQLVFISPRGMGCPLQEGQDLELYHHSGRLLPLGEDESLRIAHPVDLLETGEWHLWQRECFLAERIQPFKQVFRELYLLAPSEVEQGGLSRRYAGQQVNPRQALALFRARGWVVAPEEGVHKTFHALGISARVGFLQAVYTPAEVEGLTLEGVMFTPRGEWRPLPLESIDRRLFSEVMRDLDLVVSVAHAGGVDPEASASSVESRSALIRETCTLLNLHNVRLSDRHALIDGELGNYTVHLGSAVVHKQPGGALCIIPVHSQQRGRLFLPFVDNDPKSAEVVSKVVALARDSEIRDPIILEQILR